MNRRLLLQAGLTTGLVSLAAQAGLLTPTAVLAADWPADAFLAESYDEALAALLSGAPVNENEGVRIEASDIAEDGASVPVAVHANLSGPLTVVLLSVNNPTPAVGLFELSPRLNGYLSTRIKMAKSGDVVAVVSADGRHFSARHQMQVTSGGCG